MGTTMALITCSSTTPASTTWGRTSMGVSSPKATSKEAVCVHWSSRLPPKAASQLRAGCQLVIARG